MLKKSGQMPRLPSKRRGISCETEGKDMKCYVPIYFDRPENTQDLTCEEKGNLIKAVVNYACGREYEHLDTGTVSIV